MIGNMGAGHKTGNMMNGIGKTYLKTGFLLFAFIALVAFAVYAPDADAYSNVANCANCHTFGSSSSPFHTGHLGIGLPQSCQTCHVQTGDTPVTSRCVTCHLENGLRNHHRTKGVTACNSCHGSSAETAPPENTVPPGYAGTGLNPCNGSEELFASLTISLDNDGDGLTDSADPDCQAAANRAPVLAPIGNKSATVGSALTFTASATDPDAGQTRTFSLVGAPAGASINATSGAFTWTPTAAQVGSPSLTVRVTDNGSPAMSDEETITVTVTAVPAAGAMSVAPAGGLTSSGAPGGPFSPPSQQYTLTNTGGASINWTASKAQPWVTLSSTGGALAAGANTTVTVSISAGANTLAAGSYNDTVTFTNTTNGTGDATRPVSLTVTAAPDTTAPVVSSIDPADTHTGIPVNTVLTVTFSEAVIVPAGSFILSDGVGTVPVTISVSGATATIDPSVILSDNTTYTATLTTAVTDLAGNALAANYSSTFTTSAATPSPVLDLDSSGGGGCAIVQTGGGLGEIAGAYGFLLLTALGIALRRRMKGKGR